MDSDEEGKLNEMKMRPDSPVFLLILDGWGIAPESEANALSLAKTPYISKLIKEYPAIILDTVKGSLNNRYLTLGAGSLVNSEEQIIYNDLSSVLASYNLRQLKIFDSERLAALSYFFNGRREDKLVAEDWLSISSATKNQAFDINFSTKKIFQESARAFKSGSYDFIVATASILDYFASLGNMSATANAFEDLNRLIKKLTNEILDQGGVLIITATCGNAEKMLDFATDMPDKKNTDNPVPFILIGNQFKGRTIGPKDAPSGDLSLLETMGSIYNIAPTICKILNLGEEAENNFLAQSLI
ncbi:MAG: hypothetical protein PHH52_00470 [Patescibacteria group bacterium]|nr:hypothetical protein [Patescibacteria group bacterium]